MKTKLQCVKWLAALSLCAALAAPSFAQRGRTNWQQNRPPKDQGAKQQHQQERQQQKQQKQAAREAQRNANRPPQANTPRDNRSVNSDRPSNDIRGNNPNRPPNAYTPPPRT